MARITLNRRNYFRPKPSKTPAQLKLDIDPNDPFYMNNAMENLRAVRQGYDVSTQDPFYLLSNSKSDVFARPQGYYIDERRLVPVGLDFIQEVSQGMVYRKSLITSASAIQETVSVTLGGKVGGEREGLYESSLAVKHTQDAISNISKSKTTAQAIGYARNKQYALVVNHPFIRLSDGFIDAVSDATVALKKTPKEANFYLDKLITKFGTHYANAVTFGAAAKMTQSYTQESYLKEFGGSRQTGLESVAKVFGAGGSAHYSQLSGKTTANSGTIGNEGATFVAVGGNGSWDQNGYSAGGTPYPILLDLRPIDELLNALNYPEERYVYTVVRNALQKRIEVYLKGKSNTLEKSYFTPNLDLLGTYFPPSYPADRWIFRRTSDRNATAVFQAKGQRPSAPAKLTRISSTTFSYNPKDKAADRFEITPTHVEFISTNKNYKTQLYPLQKSMFPGQQGLYDTYISVVNPKDKLTFDMRYPNYGTVRSALAGAATDFFVRNEANVFKTKTLTIWHRMDGTIDVRRRGEKRATKFYLEDRPIFSGARDINGTFEMIGNKASKVSFEMTSANTVKVKPSWIKNTEWWGRSGPDTFGTANIWRANPDGTISLLYPNEDKTLHFKKVATKPKTATSKTPPIGVVWGQ